MLPAAEASSVDKPAAIAFQNLLSSLRPAVGGRPSEGNGALPERSDRRLQLVIEAPHGALRRPLESAQYTSEQFQRLMADHGVVCSMSRSGNVWDNAAMESFFSSLKTERTACMRREPTCSITLSGSTIQSAGTRRSDI